MTSWQQRLTAAFSNAAKVTIMGIGNDLKADDGIGPYVIEQLQNRNPSHIELINASTVPENFLSHLIESHPQLILLIDAALMQTDPGTIQLIDKLIQIAWISWVILFKHILNNGSDCFFILFHIGIKTGED